MTGSVESLMENIEEMGVRDTQLVPIPIDDVIYTDTRQKKLETLFRSLEEANKHFGGKLSEADVIEWARLTEEKFCCAHVMCYHSAYATSARKPKERVIRPSTGKAENEYLRLRLVDSEVGKIEKMVKTTHKECWCAMVKDYRKHAEEYQKYTSTQKIYSMELEHNRKAGERTATSEALRPLSHSNNEVHTRDIAVAHIILEADSAATNGDAHDPEPFLYPTGLLPQLRDQPKDATISVNGQYRAAQVNEYQMRWWWLRRFYKELVDRNRLLQNTGRSYVPEDLLLYLAVRQELKFYDWFANLQWPHLSESTYKRHFQADFVDRAREYLEPEINKIKAFKAKVEDTRDFKRELRLADERRKKVLDRVVENAQKVVKGNVGRKKFFDQVGVEGAASREAALVAMRQANVDGDSGFCGSLADEEDREWRRKALAASDGEREIAPRFQNKEGRPMNVIPKHSHPAV